VSVSECNHNSQYIPLEVLLSALPLAVALVDLLAVDFLVVVTVVPEASGDEEADAVAAGEFGCSGTG
jgi:hypothetical protein